MCKLLQNKNNNRRAGNRLGLLAFILATIFALVLMTGCPAADAHNSAAGNEELPSQANSSSNQSGEGFVMEDSVIVDVNIEEER